MITRPLRIVFAGTPEFAAAHLRALLAWRGGEVIAVYSQPDRPAGRGKKLAASPVKELALQHQLPVLQPQTLRNAEAQAELRALQADIMIVVAYGLILPAAVLETPRLGCINVHASILPRWRGAAPIQRAIEAGDGETGVTIMQMDVGLDTGAMLNIARCPIAADETAATLHDKLARIGAPALQSMLSARVGEAEQGRLQGVLASLSSLASVFGPLLISQLYFAFRLRFPGIAWLAGAVVYLLCMPVLLRKTPKP